MARLADCSLPHPFLHPRHNSAPTFPATIHTLTTNLLFQVSLLKPFGPAIRTKTTHQNTCPIHPTTTPQATGPHPRQCTHQQGYTHLQTSPHASAHLLQPNSEAHEAEDRPPIPRHSHSNKKRNGRICVNRWMLTSTIVMAAGTVEESTAGMPQWPEALQTSFKRAQRHQGLR